uniref:Putative secreted protein n=1 Tax=Panstrongylus lignarius TaxID=156445 RepID=A0A224XXD7_9HEMI
MTEFLLSEVLLQAFFFIALQPLQGLGFLNNSIPDLSIFCLLPPPSHSKHPYPGFHIIRPSLPGPSHFSSSCWFVLIQSFHGPISFHSYKMSHPLQSSRFYFIQNVGGCVQPF